MKLKDKDYLILNYLLQNSRVSIKLVSKKLGIPINTIYDRIKRLENNDLILQYPSIIEPCFFRHGMSCIFVVKLDGLKGGLFDEYYVNSVVELIDNSYMVELNFSSIYQLNDFKSLVKGLGKIMKTYYIRECIQKSGFLF